MIDKLDVRVVADAPYTKEFTKLNCELRAEPKLNPFTESRHYLAKADLRPFGYKTIVHLFCKHGERGDHKIEIVDTGTMGFREMVHEVRRVFSIPIGSEPFLDVMRVDLAADVNDVPVSWFKDRVRVQFKRFGCEIGTYIQMGRGPETLYFGKRPNCFRIYDKVEERRQAYWRMLRRARRETESATYAQCDRSIPWLTSFAAFQALRDDDNYRGALLKVSVDADVPSYEECFGHSRDAVITRVERQMGGGRVPLEIGTVGTLRKNAAHFNPFEPFEFATAGRPEPRPCDYPLTTYAAGMWFRERAKDWGIHQLRSWINKQSSGGHGARVLRAFGDFLPEQAPVELTGARLFELYRDSVSHQLAA